MKPYYDHDGITIYHGDCREIMPLLLPESVDMVLTDPPYDKESVWLYGLLAEHAARVLKKGMYAIVLAGHFYLDTIMADMGKWLTWHWMTAMPHSQGCVAKMNFRQIMNAWKPGLCFSNGPAEPHRYMFDWVLSRRDKAFHAWGQPSGWFAYYIEHLTEPSDLVLDPFLGGGAVLRAAKDVGRRAIGIEIEERYCEIAARRLGQEVFRFEEALA